MNNHSPLGDLANRLGIDLDSPEQRRAAELIRNDREFLAALVKVRKDRGLTQEDVAARLGVTQPTVAAFERQESDPKLSTLRRYAQAVEALVTYVVTTDPCAR
jgi:DNA-binding XRE family transcriptional regulator